MTLAAFWTGWIYVALIGLLALLLIALLAGYELLRRDFRRMVRARDQEASGLEKALLLQEQLDTLSRDVKSATSGQQRELQRLWKKTDESLSDRLERTSDLVSQVRQTLGGINDASQRIYQVGAQLTSLGEALRMPPSGQGGGALWLADLLGQILPPDHYQTNAALGDGEPVDAVVKLGNFLIGIDAGLEMVAGGQGEDAGPLSRDAVREHIDQVAARCIQPGHGTVDFALMYLPVETQYYDLIIRDGGRDSISEYALSRRVIPVSPNTLYAYLYTIVLGLRGLQIEQDAQRILRRLGDVRSQFGEFEEQFRILGTHLDRATSKYDQVGRQMRQFGEEMKTALKPQKQETPTLGSGPVGIAADGEEPDIFSAMADPAEEDSGDSEQGDEDESAPEESDDDATPSASKRRRKRRQK